MSWKLLNDPDIRDFIRMHHGANIEELAFKKSPVELWPYKLILEQIRLRQKASHKLPVLFDHEAYIYPSGDIIEQASSWACALYKASLMKGHCFYDLTAGMGIDALAISRCASYGVLVESDPVRAEILAYNFRSFYNQNFYRSNILVKNANAEIFIKNADSVDCILLDPQRRDNQKKGIYKISDGEPDVIDLLPDLKMKANRVIFKSSPVLDISSSLRSLSYVKEVHVVQWDFECKEVVYILEFEKNIEFENVPIKAIEIDNNGKIIKSLTFTQYTENKSICAYGMPEKYIYEPGPSFLKSGGYKTLALHYNLKKLHPNTHLYTSSFVDASFPGRVYRVLDIRKINQGIGNTGYAELTLRNFPGTTQDLRKKLKLKEGDKYRIFACTLLDDQKRLVVCDKTV